MGFIKEFRDFALKGNVFDMAIGVIMGGAFGSVVTSLIKHVLSPILGLAGGANFTEMFVMLKKSDKYAEGMKYSDAQTNGSAFGYGAFVTDVINFLIMAFVVFLMVKAYTKAKKRFDKEAPAPAPAGPSEKDYLREIRDLLTKR